MNVLYNAKYGEGPNVCSIKISDTNGKAADFTADYTGASGGYNITSATLYLGIETGSTFSVDKFKSELDAADVIVAYAGTTLADASESNDRESLKLPDLQSHVKEICAVDDYAKKTVVVQSVGQVDTSDFANCKALLWNSYNGQTQGTAIGKVLSGKVNPSGKCTTTWYNPADMGTSSEGSKLSIKSDGSLKSPTGLTSTKYSNYNIKNTDKSTGRTYQYYTGTPVYPFEYGLSYTNYTYSNLSFDKNSVDANGTVEISVDVTNNGTVNGDEAVQMYVTVPENGENMPEKQLKGFERVSIDAGQTKTVKMTLDISDCTFFSESGQKMYVPNGEYTISVG